MTQTPEAPEFHTQTLSPLSPLPLHPPEPANIPVLQNQTDPVFNMTSTHIDPDPSQVSVAAPAESTLDPIVPASKEGSPSAASSFSDAYKEQPAEAKVVEEDKADQGTEVSDDYAMTFDSDAEGGADSHDITQANIEQQTEPLPATVPATDIPSSLSNGSHTNEVPTNGLDAQSTLPAQTSPPSHPTIADTATANLSSNPPAQVPAKPAPSQTHTYEDIANGDIDIQQLLDNITANAEKNESASTSPTTPAHNSSFPLPKAAVGMTSHASLPPRPQNPPRPYNDDMQLYHAGPPGLPPQAASSYRPPPPPGTAGSLVGAGAPGTSTDPRNGLPPPPTASFRPPTSAAPPINQSPYSQLNPTSGQAQPKFVQPQDEADEVEARWGPGIQRLYDQFLADERMYVTEGLWDRFPVGSRLFIGNLPSEKVTKRDLFHVFHNYGKLAQISIKQAYGFIQFHDAAECYAALEREQGAEVRGRKMHLEISKPQKNSRNAQANAPPLRRSRSPDRAGRQGQNGGRGVDRYDGRAGARQDEYGRPLRTRDDYRPVRPPTPPRGSFRSRDEYNPRGRDSYDSRDRRRSRSRSPYGRENVRYRERSLSPRGREAIEDMDLQIPRREPRDIPDVQIILMDQLDRGFVGWVEGEFRGRGIKTEVMFLSSRLPLESVIRRQILEGVHAVSQLTMRSQNSSKIPLQVFDRQGGANNVRWDEYQDLEPRIAAELVLRAKQTAPPLQPPEYAQPQFAAGQQYPPQTSVGQAYQQPHQQPQPSMAQAYQQPQSTAGQPYQPSAPAPSTPNLANLIGQLDNNAALQNLLSSINLPQQHQNAPSAAANSTIDLAGLLGGIQQSSPQQGYAPQAPQPVADQYAALAANPSLASLLGGGAASAQAQVPTQQSAQQVQNIMAQLAKYRK